MGLNQHYPTKSKTCSNLFYCCNVHRLLFASAAGWNFPSTSSILRHLEAKLNSKLSQRFNLFINGEAIKTCISVWQATFLPLMLGATLWWTSITSRGEQKYSETLHATETRISSGLMGHLARTCKLYLFSLRPRHVIWFCLAAAWLTTLSHF